MKFSPHFPSFSCVVRNAFPAPVSLALPLRARPACLYLRVPSNPSWQLQAHFQISLELLCRRLGFQALWCRGRQTRHLHPLDGNRPWCLLCPVPPRPWRLSSRLMQIDQVLLSLIHQLKPWLCLLTALGAAASRSEMGPLQMSHGSLVPSQSEQNCTSRAHSTVAIKTQKVVPVSAAGWPLPGSRTGMLQVRAVLAELGCWQRRQEEAHRGTQRAAGAIGQEMFSSPISNGSLLIRQHF